MLRRERPRQDDVSVEDAADLVRDGLVEVVAFDEHRVDGRDAADRALARALEEPREHRKDARRVTAADGWLPRREPDLALSPRAPA